MNPRESREIRVECSCSRLAGVTLWRNANYIFCALLRLKTSWFYTSSASNALMLSTSKAFVMSSSPNRLLKHVYTCNSCVVENVESDFALTEFFRCYTDVYVHPPLSLPPHPYSFPFPSHTLENGELAAARRRQPRRRAHVALDCLSGLLDIWSIWSGILVHSAPHISL